MLAIGCAAKAPAADKLVAAREAIARAAQAGGDTYAPADMLSARSGLERAQAALQKGEMASARSQTEQAVVDAQLAEAKVRSAKAQAAAASVRAALVRMGVGDSRLSVVGYGETYPAASNGGAEGRMANRRVEVVLSDDAGRIAPR